MPAAVGSRVRASAFAAILAVSAACQRDRVQRSVDADEPRAVGTAARLQPLHEFEERRRSEADFAAALPGMRRTGQNPHALVALPEGRFVGVLRGADAVVLLDADGRERARAAAPAEPVAVVSLGADEVVVAGAQSSKLAHFRVVDDRLQLVGELVVPDVTGTRALAGGPGRMLYAVDDHRGTLRWLRLGRRGELEAHAQFDACRGPMAAAIGAGHLVVDCLLDRALRVYALDDRGVPQGPARTIVHDGPLWSVTAPIALGDGVVFATGGVEDRPLDRSQGFGFVDSFVYLYRLDDTGPALRIATHNVSELGVVTPKWLALAIEDGRVRVDVTGYGADRRASIAWPLQASGVGEPETTVRAFPPGVTAVAGRLAADPLLDAWVVDDDEDVRVQPVPGDQLDPRIRLGEALVFTTLIAPWNEAEGMRSRFTCETCHFEGYADGRVHYTGRRDVHAVTKPLLGLFNNRPHFSRALDPDMATMVDNEFVAANKGSDRDPWFDLEQDEIPWAAAMGELPQPVSAVELRTALMAFLMEFAHAPNPATLGRARFTDLERAGADVFRARCERCHEARRVADDPASHVDFADWEAGIFAPAGPIVWARDGYEKTGVIPYVHSAGTRTPSLRRLYKKHPYFTNGSADDLDEILRRVAYGDDAFWHDGAPSDAPRLSPDERDALRAFVELL